MQLRAVKIENCKHVMIFETFWTSPSFHEREINMGGSNRGEEKSRGLLFILLGQNTVVFWNFVSEMKGQRVLLCAPGPFFFFLSLTISLPQVFQLHLAFTSSMFDRKPHKGGQRHPSLLFHSAQLAVTWCSFPPPSPLPSPYSRTLQV